MTSRNVNINIGASTRRYKKAVRSAEKATTKFGGSIGKLGKVAVAAGAAAVIAIAAIGAVALKVGINAVKGFAKFEQSMSRIEGLVGVSHDKVAAFSEQVKELAVATAIGPQALAEGLFFITSAGLEGAEAMAALEVSAKASAAGLGEVTIIADVVTSAVNAFGDSMGGAAVATDVLVATVREGKAEAPALASALGRVIPIASQMGISFDQVGASIAAMTRVGLDANEASTALRSIMVSLLKPTTQADEALASMGLSAQGLRDQIRSEGLFATLQTLTDAFDGNAEATTAVFGNIRALSGVMSLMGSNAEATEEIFRELANSTGSLDSAFGVAADTGAFAFEQARARIDVALLGIGEDLMPIIADAVDDIIPHVEDMLEVFGKLAVILAELGAAAIPPVVDFLEDIPEHARTIQIMGLEWAKFADNFNTILTFGHPEFLGLGDVFSQLQAGQLKFLKTQQQVAAELGHGVDAMDAGTNALHDMSEGYNINTENLGVLQRQLGFTDMEMLVLINEFEDARIAAGGWDQSIGQLEMAQVDLTDKIKDAQTPLSELKATHIAFRDALDRTTAAIDNAGSAFVEFVSPIQAVRNALNEVREAGENVASMLLEMTNPTFKAISATDRWRKAEEKLAEEKKKAGKNISEDEALAIALAQVEIVKTKLAAESALQDLGLTDFDAVEAGILSFMEALDFTRQEAFDLFNQVGIMDGFSITMLMELQTSITGPLAGGFGEAAFENQGETQRFRIPGALHGGRVRAGAPITVGEGGVELFVPDASGRIIPNGDLTSMNTTSTSSEKTINLYIEGTETPGQDAESLLLLAGLVA